MDAPAPAGAGPAGTAAADPWWRVLCGVRQREPAPQVVARARAAAGGALGRAAQEAVCASLAADAALLAAGLCPDAAYCERVVKVLALAAEADGEFLCDRLVELQSGLLIAGALPAAAGSPPAEGWCVKTYAYGNREGGGGAPTVTLHLALNLFEGSTGCHEWEAGFFLAEFVLGNPQRFRGKRCCELGAGAGVVGVALHRVGAKSVELTDGDAATVRNLERNLGLNGIRCGAVDRVRRGSRVGAAFARALDGASAAAGAAGSGRAAADRDDDAGDGSGSSSSGRCRVSCRVLSWEEAAQGPLSCDVLVGSDLLYDPAVIPTLVEIFRGARKPRAAAEGAEVWLATAVRNEATLDAFEAAAAKAGLVVRDASKDGAESPVRFHHHLTLQRDKVRLHCITAPPR